MAARLPALDAEEAKGVAESLGMPVTFTHQPVWQTLLQRPRFAKALSDLLTDLRYRSVLDDRLFELIVLRIGWRAGSCLEWSQHWAIADRLGLDHQDLLAVREWEASDRFSTRDRAALQCADDAVTRGFVSQDAWNAAAGEFDGPELFEIVAVVSTYLFLHSFTGSLEIPMESDAERWPPDGQVSPWCPA